MPQDSDFVHLHVHSDYSLIDGAAKVEALAQAAKRMGHKALALTDHGTLSGSVAFYKACKKEGIKPILGCEAYLAWGDEPDAHKRREERKAEEREGAGGRDYNHLTILAKNEEGWKNLTRLATIASLDGFYYKPRMSWDLLRQHHQGLIVMSGCLKGEVATPLRTGRYDVAKRTAARWKELLGDDYYLEVQPNSLEEQAVVNDSSLRLSKELGIKLVAACDLHYVDPADAEVQEVKICIQTGKKLKDMDRLKMSPEFYFRTTEDVFKRFSHCPEAIFASREIAEKVENLDILPGTKGKYFLPKFQTPDGTSGPEYFRRLCYEGLSKRYRADADKYRERLDYEMGVIEKMGFVDYFLILQDVIAWSKANGCPVGPGRGSAAGAIVAYCLEITDIEPIRYGLLFERFLNPDRVSMPDIDVDFCETNRWKAIAYVRKKYGDDRVCQIATFGELKAKSAIKDVGRVLDVPFKEANGLSDLVPKAPDVTLDMALRASPDLAKLRDDDRYKRLFDLALRAEGLYRNIGRHAAGIVIGDVPLIERIPLMKVRKDEEGKDTGEEAITTQFVMQEVEDVGLVKMDFLGLRTVTLIEDALRMVEKSTGKRIDKNEIPVRDALSMVETTGAHRCWIHERPFSACRCCDKTLEVYQRGFVGGVFQVEGEGMRQLLMDMKCDRFDDVVAGVALYRPGPMGTGMHEQYVRRKNGEEEVEFDHPSLEGILGETYGLIVYQESLMSLSRTLAGFSKGKSDELRKATAKKIPEKMAKLGPEFIEGCERVAGLHRTKAQEIWDKIVFFSSYSFNKSHSAAYARLSWHTAWLKANYPVEFTAALLNSWISVTDKLQVYVDDCRRIGVPLDPPDVNVSSAKFDVVVSGGVRRISYGLEAVRGVGLEAAEHVAFARKKAGGRFRSFLHFCESVDHKVVKAATVEKWAMAGAFRSLGNRGQIMPAVERTMAAAASARKSVAKGQGLLFGGAGGESIEDRRLDDELLERNAQEPSQDVVLGYEKEALGFHLTASPLDGWRESIDFYSSAYCGRLSETKDAVVRLCGVISDTFGKTDKNGNMMAFFTLEDFTGGTKCVVFASVYDKVKARIRQDAKVIVEGRIQRHREPPDVVVIDMQPLTRNHQVVAIDETKRKSGEATAPDEAKRVKEAMSKVGRPRRRLHVDFVVEDTEERHILGFRQLVEGWRSGPDHVLFTFVRRADGQRAGPFQVGGLEVGLAVEVDEDLRFEIGQVVPQSTVLSVVTEA